MTKIAKSRKKLILQKSFFSPFFLKNQWQFHNQKSDFSINFYLKNIRFDHFLVLRREQTLANSFIKSLESSDILRTFDKTSNFKTLYKDFHSILESFSNSYHIFRSDAFSQRLWNRLKLTKRFKGAKLLNSNARLRLIVFLIKK